MRRCRYVGAHVRCARATQMQAQNIGYPAGYCVPVGKRHTSKRVSVIACDNVISKAKCATRDRPHQTRIKRTLMKIQSSFYFLQEIILD